MVESRANRCGSWVNSVGLAGIQMNKNRNGKNRSLYLDDETIRIARLVGKGSASQGIRLAVLKARPFNDLGTCFCGSDDLSLMANSDVLCNKCHAIVTNYS
jgi:hypothetical protein